MKGVWFRGVFLHAISQVPFYLLLFIHIPSMSLIPCRHSSHSVLMDPQSCPRWLSSYSHTSMGGVMENLTAEISSLWEPQLPVLGSCCYVEVTEKLSVSRQIAKIRHPHLLMFLCTLPVPNALDGYSGSCTAGKPVQPLIPCSQMS